MHGVRAVTREQSQHGRDHVPDNSADPSGPPTLPALRPDNDSEIAHAIRDATAAIGQLIADANEIAVIVLKGRIATAEPVTLAEIGRRVSRTGERIRGIESRLRSQIDEALSPFLAQVISPLREWLGDFAGDDQLRGAIAALAGGTDDLAGRIIARRLMVELGYQDNGGIWASRRAVDAAGRIATQARGLSDDFGCVDEARLRQTELGRGWSDAWDQMLLVAGLRRMCGVLVLASTRQAHVAAALRSIGRPATRTEIEDRLRPEIDGRMFRVDAALAAMEGVVRASKTTWGFEEWVDDVYEGIPAEIRQRINEDGGATRLSRLLDEIPRLFDVRESSVRAYLETPAFRVEHGWVSETNGYSGPLGTLDEVADGATELGDPFWTFNVESRFLKGYSLPGVPPEVSIALGVGFGEKSTASVRFPTGCSDVSVIWRTTSMQGPEIGRLASALEALQAADGELIGLVIHGPGEISFVKAQARPIAASIAAPPSAASVFWHEGHRHTGVRIASRLRAHASPVSKSRRDHEI